MNKVGTGLDTQKLLQACFLPSFLGSFWPFFPKPPPISSQGQPPSTRRSQREQEALSSSYHIPLQAHPPNASRDFSVSDGELCWTMGTFSHQEVLPEVTGQGRETGPGLVSGLKLRLGGGGGIHSFIKHILRTRPEPGLVPRLGSRDARPQELSVQQGDQPSSISSPKGGFFPEYCPKCCRQHS